MFANCPVCGTSFEKYNRRHTYDCRKCFKKAYDLKEKMEKKRDEISFPLFICPHCGKETQLTFNVKRNLEAWSHFHCPHCGKRNNLEYLE